MTYPATPSPLPPQELYLLERYSSPEYFMQLRDTWGAMIEHVEAALSTFMRNLPLDYRARQLPQQPDVVWGQRVLPNFRDTYQRLCEACIRLTHGDLKSLGASYGVLGDFKGQLEFSTDWMPDNALQRYGSLLNDAVSMASNIAATERADWEPFDLSSAYQTSARGPLNLPPSLPTYRRSSTISVRTGVKPERAGLYVADQNNSCAQFLVDYNTAPMAAVHLGTKDLLHPVTGEKYGEDIIVEQRECTWFFVERIEATQDAEAHDTDASTAIRIPGGEICPLTGFYFTPARADSRQKFNVGDIMPAFESPYGAVIWQWDAQQ